MSRDYLSDLFEDLLGRSVDEDEVDGIGTSPPLMTGSARLHKSDRSSILCDLVPS